MKPVAQEDDLRYEVKWRADRIRYKIDGTVDPYELNVTLDAHVEGSPFKLVVRRSGETRLFSTQTRG